MTIINRIFNYWFILFIIYLFIYFIFHLSFIITTVVKLRYVSFIIKLLLDLIGLDDGGINYLSAFLLNMWLTKALKVTIPNINICYH